MMDPIEFRRVMGHFASGVAVVTTRQPDGAPCGLTVNAFCSVSLEPTLVLVCVERGADSHDCIHQAGVFAVNVLAQESEATSRRFAAFEVSRKYEGIAYHMEATGAPVLNESLAWLDCRVTISHAVGDHTVFIGEVLAGDAREGDPLVYYRGGYGRFKP